MRDSPNLRCSTKEDMVTMGTDDEHLSNSYGDVDDCVPIDLSKKSSPRELSRENDIQSEERSSPAYPGNDLDKTDCNSANWLGSWQRMVASAVSPLLSPFLYLGNGDFSDSLKSREESREKSPVRANGLPIGLTMPYFFGTSGGFENYPVMCDQFGVRYALVRTPDGHHVMPVPLAHHLHGAFDVSRGVESMLYQPMPRYERDKDDDREESESAATKHSKDQAYCTCGHSRDYQDKSSQLSRFHRHSCPLANGRRSPDDTSSVNYRLQSSSPESYSSLRAILSRKIADVFSTTNGHTKSSDKLENRSLKELLNAAPRVSREFSDAERYPNPPSPPCVLKRWHSCSELPSKDGVVQDEMRTLDRRRSKSDSHIPPTSTWTRSQYFEPNDSLDGLKRKADNDSEEDEDNEDQPPDKVGKMQILKCPITRMHNPKSQTDRRQRQKDRVYSSEDDPMDLRAPDHRDDPSHSLNSEQETLLKQLRHVAPPGFPWNVYGYYHHLMQKYQEQEILKRLSASGTTPCSTPDMGGAKSPSAAVHSYGVPPPGLTSSVGGITENGSEEGDSAAALRKRASRVLTGKHVRHGTGASPTTLMTLRQMIQERQRAKEIALAQGTLNLTGTNGKQTKSLKNSKKAAKVGSSDKKK